MNDFVIRRKEERMFKAKTITLVKPTKKRLLIFLKVIAFIAAFAGLIFMSLNSKNLMLNEILISGGIFSIVFLIHNVSNH